MATLESLSANIETLTSNLATLNNNVSVLEANRTTAFDNITDISLGVNTLFILMSGYLVFLMQAGFAMLTAGSVRSKNTKNVLLKNVLDACVGAIAYWIFGYAFAYGGSDDSNAFIGVGNFALSGSLGVLTDGEWGANGDPSYVYTDPSFGGGNQLHFFFFQWAFAATAATIVSGSVAERTSFYAYMTYAFFLTAFVYPVVSHWVWDSNGWLNTLYGDGETAVIDFAGCTVVHMVGGFAGLTGAAIVGPRLGRFDSEGKVVPIPGHSATLATLGTFLLWFGWYGFNPGSALALTGKGWLVAERCAVTTTLAAATGGVVTLVVIKLRDQIFDLIACLNGILAGLVSITAACAFVEPYAAVVIGAIGALVYIGAAQLLLMVKIDDPLEAFPIHGAAGMWGAIAPGLFNRLKYQEDAGFSSDTTNYGAFYGGGGRLLGANVVAILVIAAWTVALLGPMFFVLHKLQVLRISPEEEIIGNDVSKHGGVAYPIDAAVAAEKAAAHEIENFGMDDNLRAENQPHPGHPV